MLDEWSGVSNPDMILLWIIFVQYTKMFMEPLLEMFISTENDRQMKAIKPGCVGGWTLMTDLKLFI